MNGDARQKIQHGEGDVDIAPAHCRVEPGGQGPEQARGEARDQRDPDIDHGLLIRVGADGLENEDRRPAVVMNWFFLVGL
jgi:hypothetical protein